jgi:hypothetical protein
MNAPDDPYGYTRLHQFLLEAERALSAAGKRREASRLHQASLFYGGGSPTEFLGESRRALIAVLEGDRDLPPGLPSRMRAILAEIDEGFRAIGGG